jgi:hypothetical protein
MALKRERRRSHMWSEFFVQYTVCRRTNRIYMQVVEGKIMYRVYADCSGENNVYTQFSSKVNHISEFMGRYRSIQDDK